MHYVHRFLTGHLVLPFFSAFFILGPAAARLVNITVDDQNPDPLTGNTFTYSPSDHWEIGNGCQSCAARLDPSQTLDATWHDATYFASVSGSEVQTASLQFTGSAIYVFGIISQSSTSFPSTSSFLFFIDGQLAGTYAHTPLGLDNTFDYNVSFWSSESLPPGPHRFELQNGQANGSTSLILFDYVVYTTDDGTSEPSEAPNTSSGSQASTTTDSDVTQPSSIQPSSPQSSTNQPAASESSAGQPSVTQVSTRPPSTTRSSATQSSAALQSTPVPSTSSPPSSQTSAAQIPSPQHASANSLSASGTFFVNSMTSVSSSASPAGSANMTEKTRKAIAASVATVSLVLAMILAILFYLRCRKTRRSQEGATQSSSPVVSVTPFHLNTPQIDGQERHGTLPYMSEDYPTDKISDRTYPEIVTDPEPLHSDEPRTQMSPAQSIFTGHLQMQNVEDAPPSYVSAL